MSALPFKLQSETGFSFASVVCCAKTTDSDILVYDLLGTEHYEEQGKGKPRMPQCPQLHITLLTDILKKENTSVL
ncbi:MAG TPA: hypothetical protein VN958_22275, partial [Chitinophagaceae bacterium]|nr:hypothetical protein [Chitinophagaceae bacterium]